MSLILFKRGTALQWQTLNPVLAEGETGVEIDVNPMKFKIGDGKTLWNNLPYENVSGGSGSDLSATDIKNKLETLSGDGRLSASAIKDLPESAIRNFTDLVDVPNDYTGKNNHFVMVNDQANGLKFELVTYPQPETGGTIRDKLGTLSGDERLDAQYIKNIPSTETGATIRDKLAALSGTDRLPANAIKNLPEETGADIKSKLESLQGTDRLSASAIKDLPTTGGAVQFTGLTDTPGSYTGHAHSIVEVNSTETGLNFISPENITFDTESLFTSKAIGVDAVPDGFIPHISQWVRVLGSNEQGFIAKEIDAAADYKGELIGRIAEIRNPTGTGEAYVSVELIASYLTGVTDANEGQIAYMGIVPGGITLSISKNKNIFSAFYGMCGHFGQIKKPGIDGEINARYVLFDAFLLQASQVMKELDTTHVEYLEVTQPAIIPSDAFYVVYKAIIPGNSTTLIQDMPDVTKVATGSMYLFENLSTNYNNIIHLEGINNQQIAGGDTFEIKGKGCRTILIAGKTQWEVFYNVDPTNYTGQLPTRGVQVQDGGTNFFNNSTILRFPNATVRSLTQSDGSDPVIEISVDDGIGIMKDNNVITNNAKTIEFNNCDVSVEQSIATVTPKSGGLTIKDASNLSYNNDTLLFGSDFSVREQVKSVTDSTKQTIVEPKLERPYGALAYIHIQKTLRYSSGNVRKTRLKFENEVVKSQYIVIDNDNMEIDLYNDVRYGYPEGKTPILISFRCAFKGKTDEAIDSTVKSPYYIRLNLRKVSDNSLLLDANNMPATVARKYDFNQDLGIVEYIGIFELGTESFYVEVEDNMDVSKSLRLQDRNNGGTGICIQYLTSNYKTGDALIQYQIDNQQSIEFNYHHFNGTIIGTGDNNARWSGGDGATNGVNAGYTSMENDEVLNALTPVMMGTNNGLVFSNAVEQDGTTPIPCQFAYGVVFPNELTEAMKGQAFKINVTTEGLHNDFYVMLLKWTGDRDAFNSSIITRIDDNPSSTAPDVWVSTNWWQGQTLFMNARYGPGSVFDDSEHTYSGDFSIDADSNNVAIMIYPRTKEAPMYAKIKKIEAVTINPINFYQMHSIALNNEYVEALGVYYDRIYLNYMNVNYDYGTHPFVWGGRHVGANDGEVYPMNDGFGINFRHDGYAKIISRAEIFIDPDKNTSDKFTYIDVLPYIEHSDGSRTDLTQYNVNQLMIYNAELWIDLFTMYIPIKAGDVLKATINSGANGVVCGKYTQSSDVTAETKVWWQGPTERETIDNKRYNEVKFMKNGVEVTNQILVYNVDDGRMTVEEVPQ